jgi:Putative metal-binding motif
MKIVSNNRVLLVTFILTVLFSFNLSIPQLVQRSEAYPSVYVSEIAAKNNPFYKTGEANQLIYDYFPSSDKKESNLNMNEMVNQLMNSLVQEKVARPEICGDGQDNDGNGQVDEYCNVGNIPQDGNQPPQVEPEQEICGDGQDNDGNGQVDENCNVGNIPQDNGQSSDGKKNFDRFGVLKIYPTKQDGEQWYLKSNPNDDPRYSPQTTLTKNSDGSFKVKSPKVRMGVFTSSGFHPEKINTLNHNKIAQAGYMQSPNDWRDVEITGYVKLKSVNSGSSNDNFVWYARGGRHTGFGSPQGCEGVAYKGGLFYGGATRWEKEQWHSGGYVFAEFGKNIGPIKGKWVGLKVIMYNIVQNGKTAVKLELWVDKSNNNNWIKATEKIDKGGWGNNGGECGGKRDQIITWGGPIAAFRWDGATDVDIKKFSVREIVPQQ